MAWTIRDALSRKRSWARRCRAARLEPLANGPEIDAGSAVEMRVPVRVHCGRRAVDAELLVRVRREVADRVDRDPELERNHLVRHASCFALERRALAGGQWARVRCRRSPHASTHPPHPRRATRLDTVANGRHAGAGCVLRSSRPRAATPGHTCGPGPVTSPPPVLFATSSRWMRGGAGRARWLRSELRSPGAGCGTRCGIGSRSSRPVSAEAPVLLRRGRDSNPWEPCDSSGFQVRSDQFRCAPMRSFVRDLFPFCSVPTRCVSPNWDQTGVRNRHRGPPSTLSRTAAASRCIVGVTCE